VTDLGFVDLGAMGAGSVMRLLDAGHSVTGWNRTTVRAETPPARGSVPQ
jgi:3-hydroxyisobutyrate dehydrogenase-like beta-hydroxyacid dehydrogenase